MSLQSQNSSKWRSNLCSAVQISQILICPLPSSSRSSMALRQKTNIFFRKNIFHPSFLRYQNLFMRVFDSTQYSDLIIQLNYFRLSQERWDMVDGMVGRVNSSSYFRINFQSKLYQTMFKMIGSFCQTTPCFLNQEKSLEVEVPAFFQVQQQINQLPSFESQYHHLGSPSIPPSPRDITQNHWQTPEPTLKRIKSQPNGIGEVSVRNQKENYRSAVSKKYQPNSPRMVPQSIPRPSVRILYESKHNQPDTFINHDLLKSQAMTHQPQKYQPMTANSSAMVSPFHPSMHRESESTKSVVSVQEFNRVVNMNKNLIKMIEEDYRPMQVSVDSLRQEQREREKLIEVLEERVRGLRQQVGGDGREMPVRRFY